MRKKLMAMLESREEEMIEIRRHLHENPELSFQEKETATFIGNFYKGKDVHIETNVGNGYGIIVTITGAKPGKTIGLRADFDALPITEEADVPFKSKNEGVMHACAHDAHTAYLLVLADCLIQLKNEFNGSVKMIHQHAEETPPGGAKSILDSGKLDDLDAIYGLHLLPLDSAGTIGYRSGFAFSGRSTFKLKIQGKGGHGASPHTANDAIVAGAHFVTAVQTVVSRRLNPVDAGVITIGSFDGKGTFNVIKDSIELEGDVRYLSTESQQIIEKEFKRIVKGVEIEFDVNCTLEYESDYPPLNNNPEHTAFIAKSLLEAEDPVIKEVKEYKPLTPSEDFAYYLEKIPGSYFFVGCKPKGVEYAYFNHHPKFDIDEDAILVAAKAVGHIVCSSFEE